MSATGTRLVNEDALGEGQRDNMVCFVMADGAGGHARGDVAARTVVDTVRNYFLQQPAFSAAALAQYTGAASEAVERGKQLAGQHDMSATVAVVLIDQRQRQVLWSHVGDTRVYLFRDGRAQQLTRDHSVAQQLVDAGYIAQQRLRGHPQRHLLYAAIGADPGQAQAQTLYDNHDDGDNTDDGADDGAHGSDSEPLALSHGDAMLICTDGFWESVLESDMEASLALSADSAAWLTAMCAIGHRNATASGKHRDNFTACAICLYDTGPDGERL
jgi:serine/threonine protein phosphatase PrpC